MSHLLCFTIFNPQKNTCEVAVAFLFYKSANQGQRHQERHLRPLVWHPACWEDSFERHDNSFKKWTPSLYCWPWKSSENLQVSLYPLSRTPLHPPHPCIKSSSHFISPFFWSFSNVALQGWGHDSLKAFIQSGRQQDWTQSFLFPTWFSSWTCTNKVGAQESSPCCLRPWG